MSLFVLVTGYGNPDIALKQNILLRNIERIQQHAWSEVAIHVAAYDNADVPSPNLPKNYTLQVYRKKGIVGDFMREHLTADKLNGYDYVLMLLDDVLLMPNIQWDKILEWKEQFSLNIVSPSLTLDSQYIYKYMLTTADAHTLKIGPACEFFTYLMDKDTALKYVQHVTEDNPWTWGLDLILYKHMHLRVGIINKMNIKHFIKGSSYKNHGSINPIEGFNALLERYDETEVALQQLPSAFYYIVEVASPKSATKLENC
jgi:hypothetical protein